MEWGRPWISDLRFKRSFWLPVRTEAGGSGRGLGQQRRGSRSRVVGRKVGKRGWLRGRMDPGLGRKETVRSDQPGRVHGRDGTGTEGQRSARGGQQRGSGHPELSPLRLWLQRSADPADPRPGEKRDRVSTPTYSSHPPVSYWSPPLPRSHWLNSSRSRRSEWEWPQLLGTQRRGDGSFQSEVFSGLRSGDRDTLWRVEGGGE